METKYILHGGHPSAPNNFNEGYFKEMADSVPEEGVLLVIYFAVEEKKIPEKFDRFVKRIDSYAGTKKITVQRATKENFIDEINQSDVIYIVGGDTQKLKLTLDNYPEFVDAIKGKVVSGSSAGAYILSSFYFTNTEGAVKEGYGCVPVRVICHYESTGHPISKNIDPVLEIGKYDPELELVLLRDCEWKVFNV